ncbi:ribosomal-protein-alanine N-acetyltransferase [Oceanobacillus iheyensis HTE831]|uniref:[Ribosomal protein bS18]-alanine N-acetyltransferase n=1 Tax=Oceanobacillus iheyensis (strain DSM 14371 / CIP 107618 / JCM 11309 / KCTC 3954 / HTE831) TaxID=221109 RepID=Q8ESI7_OCEIH|nr:ribosomal protein S18-alanine N-acetyltransferase [Oceanobacillus iheyensis]BAC12603.1 ribosomal-protein-alanine N-acetyltransferase [Oceanobacillus iheyensis HTE831]
MNNITMRPMELADIPEVLHVENACFQTPWTTDIFYQELIENAHAYYYVVEVERTVVGYIGSWMVLDDAQITNFAILPSYRRNKLGEKLFRYLMQIAIAKGVERLSLEVRASNIAAQSLYRKFGLVPGGVRKRYYTDNHEDAIVMWVNLK